MMRRFQNMFQIKNNNNNSENNEDSKKNSSPKTFTITPNSPIPQKIERTDDKDKQINEGLDRDIIEKKGGACN